MVVAGLCAMSIRLRHLFEFKSCCKTRPRAQATLPYAIANAGKPNAVSLFPHLSQLCRPFRLNRQSINAVRELPRERYPLLSLFRELLAKATLLLTLLLQSLRFLKNRPIRVHRLRPCACLAWRLFTAMLWQRSFAHSLLSRLSPQNTANRSA